MPRLIDDPEHWWSRAAEARAMAEQISDPEARRMMEGIAQTYDKLAARAEGRSKRKSGGL